MKTKLDKRSWRQGSKLAESEIWHIRRSWKTAHGAAAFAARETRHYDNPNFSFNIHHFSETNTYVVWCQITTKKGARS